MPVYSRRYLRQTLGRNHVRDTHVGLAGSWGQAEFSLNILDQNLADLSLSGQGMYVGAWLWVTGSEVRVASFNTGNGTYLSTNRSLNTVTHSGQEYERHDVLSPTEKNRALDEAVKRLRVRGEVTLDGVGGALGYPLPDGVEQVLDAYSFASPQGTLDRVRMRLDAVGVVGTATGPEVRISPALGASAQLVLDAVTSPSLGSSDYATVNIPDERLVLYAAEAQCWDLLVRRAPRGTADEYRRLRDEAARQYAALARNYKVPVDRPLRIA